MVMVQPGTELTAAIIDRLKNLGIDSRLRGGRAAGARSKPLDVALRELDERFVGHEEDPRMMELKAIVARQLRSAARSCRPCLIAPPSGPRSRASRRSSPSPPVVSRIMNLVNAGTVSAAEIAEEISKDQVLAAKVLKLVNSGFYGFRQPITTITHAMVLLGLDVVKTLVMTASVLDIVDTMNQYMEGLWEHSLGTARAANAIAERMNVPNPEEYALSGLLHDIGKVVIAQTFPAEHATHPRPGRRAQLPADRRRTRGARRHASGGRHVAAQEVVAAAQDRLSDRLPQQLPSRGATTPIATAVVHLADILCRAKGIGYPGDDRIPRINPDAWALLQLTMRRRREHLRATGRGGARRSHRVSAADAGPTWS